MESYGAGPRPRRRFVLLSLTFMSGKGTKQLYLNSSYFQMINNLKMTNNFYFQMINNLKMINNFKMINNLSSICYLNQELLTPESSAGTLIRYRCRYSRQFVKVRPIEGARLAGKLKG